MAKVDKALEKQKAKEMGARLKEARIEAGFGEWGGLNRLAKLAGISGGEISNIENGKRSPYRIAAHTLEILGAYLDRHIEYLRVGTLPMRRGEAGGLSLAAYLLEKLAHKELVAKVLADPWRFSLQAILMVNGLPHDSGPIDWELELRSAERLSQRATVPPAVPTPLAADRIPGSRSKKADVPKKKAAGRGR